MVGFCMEFRMRWGSMMVLCIPLVLNVTACMAGCLYDVVAASLLDSVKVVLQFASAGCWVVEVMCLRVKYMSSVGWFCVVGSIDGLYCSVRGAENAMLMRGGACAAELRLIGLGIGSCIEVGFVCDVCSFCVCCFLFLSLVIRCCDFLNIRLYVLVSVGMVSVSWFGGSLFVFIVVHVCSVLVIVVGIVGGSVFQVWAS